MNPCDTFAHRVVYITHPILEPFELHWQYDGEEEKHTDNPGATDVSVVEEVGIVTNRPPDDMKNTVLHAGDEHQVAEILEISHNDLKRRNKNK